MLGIENPKNRHSLRKTKAYVRLTLDGRSRQTGLVVSNLSGNYKFARQDSDPSLEDPSLTWNQLLSFEIEPQSIKDLPSMNIDVELMDKAMIGSDTKFGTCSLSLKDFTLGEEPKQMVRIPH